MTHSHYSTVCLSLQREERAKFRFDKPSGKPQEVRMCLSEFWHQVRVRRMSTRKRNDDDDMPIDTFFVPRKSSTHLVYSHRTNTAYSGNVCHYYQQQGQ